VNPHAFQEVAATLLESARKGYWKASPQLVAQISRAYAESVVKFGPSNGLMGGGNIKLDQYVQAAFKGTSLASQYQRKISQTTLIPVSEISQPQEAKTVPSKLSHPPNNKTDEPQQVKGMKQVKGVKLERKTEESNVKQENDTSLLRSAIENSLPFLVLATVVLSGYLYDRRIIQMQRRR